MAQTISPPVVFSLPVLVDSLENLDASLTVIPDGMTVKAQNDFKFKIGTGKATWSELDYANEPLNVQDLLQANSGLIVTSNKMAIDYTKVASVSSVENLKTEVNTLTAAAVVMTGATATTAGKEGFAPAPPANSLTSYLRGDGQWAIPPDTHWTTSIKVGVQNATADSAQNNGNVYLTLLDNTTVRVSKKISGAGATTVASDASGNITISSTNTTYAAASQTVAGLMSAADKTKLDGIAAGAQVNPSLANYVTLNGAQTITGVKTFSATPLVPTPAGTANSTEAINALWIRTSGNFFKNTHITVAELKTLVDNKLIV